MIDQDRLECNGEWGNRCRRIEEGSIERGLCKRLCGLCLMGCVEAM